MDINIVVAKKDRTVHYDIFLYYLNLISKNHDVTIYVSSSGDDLEYGGEYFANLKNIYVYHKLMPSEIFNKSVLLNDALFRMRSHYDVVCVMDIDMIYNSGFFDRLEAVFEKGCEYAVCYGQKLSIADSEYLIENVPNVIKVSEMKGDYFAGCSQIVMNSHTIDLLYKIFGFVYDESYEGWGGEDSDLSYKSTFLHKMGMINKLEIRGAWNHMYHVRREPENVENTENYLRHMKNRKVIETDVLKYKNTMEIATLD